MLVKYKRNRKFACYDSECLTSTGKPDPPPRLVGPFKSCGDCTSTDPRIELTFDQPINSAAAVLSTGSDTVDVTVQTAGNRVFITPDTVLNVFTEYTLNFSSFTGESGALLDDGESGSITFTTGNRTILSAKDNFEQGPNPFNPTSRSIYISNVFAGKNADNYMSHTSNLSIESGIGYNGSYGMLIDGSVCLTGTEQTREAFVISKTYSLIDYPQVMLEYKLKITDRGNPNHTTQAKIDGVIDRAPGAFSLTSGTKSRLFGIFYDGFAALTGEDKVPYEENAWYKVICSVSEQGATATIINEDGSTLAVFSDDTSREQVIFQPVRLDRGEHIVQDITTTLNNMKVVLDDVHVMTMHPDYNKPEIDLSNSFFSGGIEEVSVSEPITLAFNQPIDIDNSALLLYSYIEGAVDELVDPASYTVSIEERNIDCYKLKITFNSSLKYSHGYFFDYSGIKGIEGNSAEENSVLHFTTEDGLAMKAAVTKLPKIITDGVVSSGTYSLSLRNIREEEFDMTFIVAMYEKVGTIHKLVGVEIINKAIPSIATSQAELIIENTYENVDLVKIYGLSGFAKLQPYMYSCSVK